MLNLELRTLLEQYPDDAEIKVAYQPHYPLATGIDRVAYVTPDGEDEQIYLGDDSGILYLGTGEGGTNYLETTAAEELGWR